MYQVYTHKAGERERERERERGEREREKFIDNQIGEMK
jgi:hypothetical protein